jgi:hypothetical protein
MSGKGIILNAFVAIAPPNVFGIALPRAIRFAAKEFASY